MHRALTRTLEIYSSVQSTAGLTETEGYRTVYLRAAGASRSAGYALKGMCRQRQLRRRAQRSSPRSKTKCVRGHERLSGARRASRWLCLETCRTQRAKVRSPSGACGRLWLRRASRLPSAVVSRSARQVRSTFVAVSGTQGVGAEFVTPTGAPADGAHDRRHNDFFYCILDAHCNWRRFQLMAARGGIASYADECSQRHPAAVASAAYLPATLSSLTVA